MIIKNGGKYHRRIIHRDLFLGPSLYPAVAFQVELLTQKIYEMQTAIITANSTAKIEKVSNTIIVSSNIFSLLCFLDNKMAIINLTAKTTE